MQPPDEEIENVTTDDAPRAGRREWVFSLGLAPVVTLATDLIVGTAPPQRAGAAAGISETSAEFGGALLAAPRHAFTQGLQVTAAISAALAIGIAILAAALLGGVRPSSQPDRQPDPSQDEAGAEASASRSKP